MNQLRFGKSTANEISLDNHHNHARRVQVGAEASNHSACGCHHSLLRSVVVACAEVARPLVGAAWHCGVSCVGVAAASGLATATDADQIGHPGSELP